MDFEQLKSQLEKIMNSYSNQLASVKFEGNMLLNPQTGSIENVDGYNRLAQIVQMSANDCMKQIYSAIPQEYWDQMEEGESECGCSGDCEGGCCCGSSCGHCHD